MNSIIETKDLKLWYGDHQVLKGITMDIPEHQITALIGPSGCGKSTFLKTLNRMNDLVENVRITGEVKYDGKDIFSSNANVNELRKEIGMVFQKPNPFPMSIKTGYNKLHKTPSTERLYFTLKSLLTNCLNKNEYFLKLSMIFLIYIPFTFPFSTFCTSIRYPF